LIRGATREVCKLFDFEEAGFLFYDKKIKEIFTVAT